MEEKEEKGFTVRDRRTASSEGAKTSADTAKQKPESARQKPADTEKTETEQGALPLPELDFSTFVLSLATTVQVSFGNLPNPQTNQPEQNLPAAKQMIDIIGMLKDKTKGNLNTEEQNLLESILFNLRMQYVRAVEDKEKEGKK